MVKKVDDMTINEYMEYEERMKRQYSRSSESYFPTYSSHNTTIKCPSATNFNVIQSNIKFNYDSEDMELDKEVGFTTDEESVTSKHEALDPAHANDARSLNEELSSEEDLDEWLKGELEKNMSKQDEKNEEDALIAITKSIRDNDMEDAINDDNLTSNLPNQSPLVELNLGGFLLPFTIGNYSSYAIANIDASNNVMPRSICEYLMSGEDCRMWPTCDPDSKFCYGYNEVFGKNKQGTLRQWVCFWDHERRTAKGSCMGFVDFLQIRYENQRIDDTTHERRYYE
ncbi:hypothetical protein Tco_1460176 [Tanacetum coccineum]